MEVPVIIQKEFSAAEIPTDTDLGVVAKQLRRIPVGEVFVARRCPKGKPAVIITVIPEENAKKTVPPLLWLTCPSAAKEMGRLEGAGAMKDFERNLGSNAGLEEAFLSAENEASRIQRVVSAECEDVEGVKRSNERGVAGGRKGAIKCLHAHMAWYLAGKKAPLGEWCIDKLRDKGGVWCEKPPPACVD